MELDGYPTLPCECKHSWDDHLTGVCQVQYCDCTEYRPIPRSELRRREYEEGRAEAKAKAAATNKSQLKSQDFPTEAGPGHRFWVDQQATFMQANVFNNGSTPYAVVLGEYPVVDSRPGGQSVYMTYRTRAGAENGMHRARVELPDARVASWEEERGR